MAFINVRVSGQDRRLVYVDGNYDEADDQAPGPFAVPAGKHTFETLNRQRCVDFRATVRASDGQRLVEAAFVAVVPPEPIE